MNGSRKKRFGAFAVLVFLGAAAAAYVDLERRRRLEGEKASLSSTSVTPAPAITAELAKRFQDDGEFRRFCEKVHEKYLAMNARYKSLQHRRRQRTKQLDEAGKVVADESLVDIVDFPNGVERHRTLEQKDLLTGNLIEGESEVQKSIAAGKAPFQYPFLPESTLDDFAYRFDGVESLDDKPVVRIAFTPTEPFGRKTAGTIWADAETGQPVRFAGRWHKPTGLVHRFGMVAHYRPSENGFHQIRRIETDGAGGALFIFRRYVVAFDVDDYRPPEAQ